MTVCRERVGHLLKVDFGHRTYINFEISTAASESTDGMSL